MHSHVALSSCVNYYRVLPKRATAVQFTNNDQYILVSDKAGDLYRYPLTSDAASPEAEHLLGHFSMLLDMVSMYVAVQAAVVGSGRHTYMYK